MGKDGRVVNKVDVLQLGEAGGGAGVTGGGRVASIMVAIKETWKHSRTVKCPSKLLTVSEDTAD